MDIYQSINIDYDGDFVGTTFSYCGCGEYEDRIEEERNLIQALHTTQKTYAFKAKLYEDRLEVVMEWGMRKVKHALQEHDDLERAERRIDEYLKHPDVEPVYPYLEELIEIGFTRLLADWWTIMGDLDQWDLEIIARWYQQP